jgi:PelA/Pel-15E family pectate lyase
VCVLIGGGASPLGAAILGTNNPPQPLTRERIAALPKAQQSAWKEYLKRSERQLRADQAFFRNELRRHGLKTATIPPTGRPGRGLGLNHPADWYSQPEARRVADIVVSFQTPAGGWSKNLDLTDHRRAPGELFDPNNDSRRLGPADFDAPGGGNWNYVGTFDNGATVTQLRYLAKVISAVGSPAADPDRQSFLRGIDYIFAAQYPNGGWPQVWPLQGGYHDAITYNDNAMINVLNLLRAVSEGKDEFAFVPARTRTLAATCVQRGIRCLLATQIVAEGRHTVWGQQHDPLTLKPSSARNYEMPAQAAAESAGVTLFLMQLPEPDPETVAAVRAAAAWFEKTAVHDVAYKTLEGTGRQLVPAPGSGPLWARFYEIGSDRPVFGDRDKSIHDRLEEISAERRNGYAWYGGSGNRALERYRTWNEEHPPAKTE